jgi:pimeloyl-ACP methyl ester carboxylesterase
MKVYDTAAGSAKVTHGTLLIGGLNIAYREAGEPGNPQIVLLHGFPASSHQYRNLIPALADRFSRHRSGLPGFRQQ